MVSKYEWESVFATTYVTEPNKVSRVIWAWQRKKYERIGWTVDGGIWPRLRVTRPWDLTDYITSKPSPLQELLDAKFYSDGSAGIDRSQASFWKTRSYDE